METKINKIVDGMVKDTWSTGESQYTHALNANNEGLEGKMFVLNNEGSNILTTKIKEGFKVIGKGREYSTSDLYLILTNPETGDGEIGRITLKQYNDNEILDKDLCSDCGALSLGERLEDKDQEPYLEYETILSDACHKNKEDKFGFDINYPIKNIVFKKEGTKLVMYFTDSKTPRYIEISNLDTYFTKTVNCEDSQVITCPDLSKTLIFKDANPPTIKLKRMETGGTLPESTYQYFVKYCDKTGESMTEVLDYTTSIRVFDKNNITRNVGDNMLTSYAIKLRIDNLDQRFTHYKVIVRQAFPSNNEDGGYIYRNFILGVYPTDRKEVLHLNSNGLVEVTEIDEIFTGRRYVESSDVIESTNNLLVHTGIKEKAIMNLQPVVNLIGEFMKWRTFSAKDTIYESAEAASTKVGYQRDEVEPFAIKFRTKSGYKTTAFPLIGRMAEAKDLTKVSNNNDVNSILNDKTVCTTSNRNEAWQFYNTAKTENIQCNEEQIDDVDYVEVQDVLERVCVVEDVDYIENGHLTVKLDGEYTDFATFIEDNVIGTNEQTCNRLITGPDAAKLCKLLYTDYPVDGNCNTDELFEGIQYEVINTLKSNSVSTNEKYTESFNSQEFPAEYSSSTVVPQPKQITKGSVNKEQGHYPFQERTKIGVFNASFVGIRMSDEWAEQPLVGERTNEDQGINCKGAIECLKEQNPTTTQRKLTANNFKYYLDIGGNKKSEAILKEAYTNKRHKIQDMVPTGNIVASIQVERIDKMEYAVTTRPEYDDIFKNSTGNISFERDGEVYSKSINQVFKPDQLIETVVYPAIKEFVLKGVSASNIKTPKPWHGQGRVIYKGEKPKPFKIIIPDGDQYQLEVHIGFMDEAELERNNVTVNANWVKVTPILMDRDEGYIIDVSPNQNTYIEANVDFFSRAYVSNTKGTRNLMSIFLSCSDNEAVYTKEIDWRESQIIKVTREGEKDLLIEDGSGNKILVPEAWNPVKPLYIVFDTYTFMLPYRANEYNGYFSFPSMGNYAVTWRNLEYDSVDIEFEKISVNQLVTYEALCTFMQPVMNSCNVVPKKIGKFAYWESTELYPDNKYLFDSSGLKVKEDMIPSSIRKDFIDKFTTKKKDGGEYTTNLDLRCSPIRHFKFPDNAEAPITPSIPVQPFGESVVEILGVSLDENVINMALDIAEYNNIITSEERNEIIGYEVMRGDLSLERSVKSSGIVFDMREYIEGSNTIKYPNYPYNSFTPDIFNNTPNPKGFGKSGAQYTYHSPESDYSGNTVGTELSVQGFQYGTSKGVFEEVKDHPKWVILTDRAFRKANKLADLEVNLEMVISAAEMMSNGVTGAFVGMSSGAFIPVQAIAAAASVAATLIMREPRKERFRLEWLRNYENLGIPINFAYYHHSVGKYTYMGTDVKIGDKLRSLNVNKRMPSGAITVNNPITGERTTVNNKYREESVYLDVGKFPIKYNSQYSGFDNGSNASLYGLSKSAFREGKNRSIETTRNIASMYVYLKDYMPNQHSTLNSINWISTGYQSDLDVPDTCTQIFGGDTYIVRHSLKRKQAQFDIDYHRQADMTPIDYKFYNNIGNNPKYYVKYKMDTSGSGENSEYSYVLALANETKAGRYYVAPSMFYLYYYGVPYFLCESRINTNFRVAGKQMKDQFYPETSDLSTWTQQSNVDIQEPNTFNYNKALYETPSISLGGDTLSEFFNPNDDKNQAYKQGMILYSNVDNNLFGSSDPWLVYKPNNVYFSNSDWGKLQGVVGLENEAILGLYDLKSVVFNAVDTTIDTGMNPEARSFGDGKLFSRRVKDFSNSLGGFGGTQGYHAVSTEFGYFYVNSISGEVYQMVGGNLIPISSQNSSGSPTYMNNWFKNNLPFQIVGSNIKNAENIDIDNAFNGVGITLGYDNRYKRLLLTKKDYLPKVEGIEYRNKKGFFLEGRQVELTDKTKFEDVSFTIAYSLKRQMWMSFYSYKPNYYITDRDTFYTGINTEGKEKGLWVHGKTNKSFQVFYGKRYPFEVDFAVERAVGSLIAINDIKFDLTVYKYHNNWDKAIVKGMFDKVYVYSGEVNSGELRPDIYNGTIDMAFEYPKTAPDKSYQRVLVTPLGEDSYVINNISNRTEAKMKNVPVWNNHPNGVDKELNYQKVNFIPKGYTLTPFRTKAPVIRLVQDSESRLSYNLDLVLSKYQPAKE